MPPARVERTVIPEDLRQRVLTAIANELERDEAEARRRVQEQGNGQQGDTPGERGVVPRPRRAPGTNGDWLPPAQARRDALPPLLGHRLDTDPHTDPLPRIGGFRADDFVARDGADNAGHPAADAPAVTSAPPGAVSTAADAPTVTAAPAGAASSAADAPTVTVPPGAVFPAADAPTVTAAPPGAASTAADAPTVTAGGAAASLSAAAAPQVADPLSGDPLVATPSAFPAVSSAAPPEFAPLPPPPGVQAAPARPVAPPPAEASPAPAAAPTPPWHTWPDDGHTWPDKTRPRFGRRYRVTGLAVAVAVLVAVGAFALVLSGRTRTPAENGSQPSGAGVVVRNLAAAWVAGQVSRTVLVACDPAMCQALSSHGMPPRGLYPLGLEAVSPLRAGIIVVTPGVRARIGKLLSSGYAPAVLASFGSGPQRIAIREIAPYGAAAYQARLRADLASRKASGAQLLHSGRIAVTRIARQQLSAGQVDSRLLIAIAEMAAVHPMYVLDFGSVAPGASPGLPLRFVDLAEANLSRRNSGRSASPGYVRAVLVFLSAQRTPFRPVRVETVDLAGGTKALRIEFPAPSPLGLLGQHGH